MAMLFLRLNGLRVQAAQDEKYTTFLRLAAGEISEVELAKWFEVQCVATD